MCAKRSNEFDAALIGNIRGIHHEGPEPDVSDPAVLGHRLRLIMGWPHGLRTYRYCWVSDSLFNLLPELVSGARTTIWADSEVTGHLFPPSEGPQILPPTSSPPAMLEIEHRESQDANDLPRLTEDHYRQHAEELRQRPEPEADETEPDEDPEPKPRLQRRTLKETDDE